MCVQVLLVRVQAVRLRVVAPAIRAASNGLLQEMLSHLVIIVLARMTADHIQFALDRAGYVNVEIGTEKVCLAVAFLAIGNIDRRACDMNGLAGYFRDGGMIGMAINGPEGEERHRLKVRNEAGDALAYFGIGEDFSVDPVQEMQLRVDVRARRPFLFLSYRRGLFHRPFRLPPLTPGGAQDMEIVVVFEQERRSAHAIGHIVRMRDEKEYGTQFNIPFLQSGS